ncbi:MAG: hypothetical protein IKX57_02115 [Oscillospiraceae bacterium]|nr:hypothetical protein [Oscillospiraceae bacterium]
MKKTMIFAAIAAMMMQAAPISASACSDDDVRAMVKTEIDLGTERVYSAMVGVGDLNDDGKITTDEVLKMAHELDYPGGAAAGLGSGYIWGRRGSFITEVRDQNGKLRVDNPKEYEAGKAAPKYSQTVEDGDTVHCYAIALDAAHYDLTVESPEIGWSLFEKVPTGTAVTFYASYYDPAKIQPTPVAGIELMQNGKGTGIKTGQDGKATLTLSQAGDFDITGNFDAAKQPNYQPTFTFHVMDAQKVCQVQVLVRTDHLASDLNAKVNVYDADNDGSITAYDVFLCTTQIYYPVGNYPNDVFGTDGTFICNVSDANGTLKRIAVLGDDAVKKTAVENGYTVEFALEGFQRTEKRAVPADTAVTTAPAATTAAAATTTAEAVTSAAQTTEAAMTSAPAETAAAIAQTTAAPAQTTDPASTVKVNANGTVKTGSLKTGDSPLPLIAGVLCILSAGVAVVTRRRKEQQN